MRGSLVRSLALWRLTGWFENLLYPALILVALVLLGQLTGLVAPPG